MIRNCGQCGKANRVPANHLADKGLCGSCKATLPPVSEPLEVDAAAFDEVIAGARVPVLVDFWAVWCPPCRAVAPEVKELASEMTGRALVLKVDTEAHPALAARYQIQSIPNFLIFRDGRLISQKAGAAPRAEMRRWLESE